MKRLFVLALALPTLAQAGTGPYSELVGKVSNFDERQVTLVTRYHGTVKVARAAIPKYYVVRPGAKVVAYIQTDGLLGHADRKPPRGGLR